MAFVYSAFNLNKSEHRWQRVFECLPAAVSWLLIFGVFALAFLDPVLAAIIIICFLFYWLLRIFYLTFFLFVAYLRLFWEGETDWNERIHCLDDWIDTHTLPELKQPDVFKNRFSRLIFRRNFNRLRKLKKLPPKSSQIFHLVLIPVSCESSEVVEASVQSILKSNFPTGQIMVLIALEERAPQAAKQGIEKVIKKHQGDFWKLLVIEHPDGISGEARVKGANVTFAAKKAEQMLGAEGIPFENVTVSCFDADTIVDKNYFSCLTYNFMLCPDRERASFQPIPVYNNNIWDVPPFARVLEMGASFFQLIEATNPEKLVTFSSHSMSFKALVGIGYWPVDMISDDSAVFWKAYLYYDGDYRVVPMYVTVSMDVVQADSFWKTVKGLYKQKRRWAWGVENFPIVIRGFFHNKKIPLFQKLRHGFKLFEGHITWATLPFIMTIIGWLPALFARQTISETVLYFSAGRITNTIFALSSFALLGSILISLSLLPKKTIQYSWLRKTIHAFEWLLLPLIFIVFSGAPALEAQTRLMLKKRLEFWVADKRKS